MPLAQADRLHNGHSNIGGTHGYTVVSVRTNATYPQRKRSINPPCTDKERRGEDRGEDRRQEAGRGREGGEERREREGGGGGGKRAPPE